MCMIPGKPFSLESSMNTIKTIQLTKKKKKRGGFTCFFKLTKLYNHNCQQFPISMTVLPCTKD